MFCHDHQTGLTGRMSSLLAIHAVLKQMYPQRKEMLPAALWASHKDKGPLEMARQGMNQHPKEQEKEGSFLTTTGSR